MKRTPPVTVGIGLGFVPAGRTDFGPIRVPEVRVRGVRVLNRALLAAMISTVLGIQPISANGVELNVPAQRVDLAVPVHKTALHLRTRISVKGRQIKSMMLPVSLAATISSVRWVVELMPQIRTELILVVATPIRKRFVGAVPADGQAKAAVQGERNAP